LRICGRRWREELLPQTHEDIEKNKSYRRDAYGTKKGNGKSAAWLRLWRVGAQQAAPLPQDLDARHGGATCEAPSVVPLHRWRFEVCRYQF
jgi:hypothetical protein